LNASWVSAREERNVPGGQLLTIPLFHVLLNATDSSDTTQKPAKQLQKLADSENIFS